MLVVIDGEIGIDLKGPSIAAARLLGQADSPQHVAPAVVYLGIVWINGNRAIEVGQRILVPRRLVPPVAISAASRPKR